MAVRHKVRFKKGHKRPWFRLDESGQHEVGGFLTRSEAAGEETGMVGDEGEPNLRARDRQPGVASGKIK